MIRLSLSVRCTQCGRQFVDIDPAMIGQKARCNCGAVVRLVALAATTVDAPSAPQRPSRPPLPPTPQPAAKAAPAQHRLPRPAPQPPARQATPGRTSTDSAAAPRPTAQPASRQAARRRPQPAAPAGAHDSFAEIDDILDGLGDTRPLRVPTAAVPQTAAIPREVPAAKPAGSLSRICWTAGGVASAAGMLFAIITLAARFTPLGNTPLSGLGRVLHGWFTASYGSGETQGIYTTLFVGLGIALAITAILTLLVAVLLGCRISLQAMAGGHVLGWTRGAAAALAVTSLFILLGALATENSHHQQLLHSLGSLQPPIPGLVEEPAQFQHHREQFGLEHNAFQSALLWLAVLPLTLFGGSMASLLLDGQIRTDDSAAGKASSRLS